MILFKGKNLVLLLILLLVINYFLLGNFFVIKPGIVEDLREIIHVEDGEMSQEEGKFYLVTVAQQPANIFLFLGSFLDSSLDLIPRWSVVPPDMDLEEYNKIMHQWMIDSQHLSKVIALERLGYEVPIRSEGIIVVDFMEDSPALNILKSGDIIKEIEGEKVFMAEELVDRIQQKPAGSEINLTLEREGKTLKKSLTTVPYGKFQERSLLGVYVRTLDWEPHLPFEIEIETGEIAGPSGGFMFVLEIMDQLTREDLSGGRRISGTGTINMEEEIGPIGGVKQKIRAAENTGVDVFFVPENNMEEARKVARDIELVEVGSLEDVLKYLNGQMELDINLGIKNSLLSVIPGEVSLSHS